MPFAVPFAAFVEELDDAACDRVVAEVGGTPKRRFETRVVLRTSPVRGTHQREPSIGWLARRPCFARECK